MIILWRCIFAPSGSSPVDTVKVVHEETSSTTPSVPGDRPEHVSNEGAEGDGYGWAGGAALAKNGERLVRSVRRWDSAVKSESPRPPGETAGDSAQKAGRGQQLNSGTSSPAESEKSSRTANSEDESSRMGTEKELASETAKSSSHIVGPKSVSHQPKARSDGFTGEAGKAAAPSPGARSLETGTDAARQRTESDVGLHTESSSGGTSVEAVGTLKEAATPHETAATSGVSGEYSQSPNGAGIIHLIENHSEGAAASAEGSQVGGPPNSTRLAGEGGGVGEGEVKPLPSRRSVAFSDAHEPAWRTSGVADEPGKGPRSDNAADVPASADGGSGRSEAGSPDGKVPGAPSKPSPVQSAENGASGNHAAHPDTSDDQGGKARLESIQIVRPQYQGEPDSTLELERTRSGVGIGRAVANMKKG